MKNPKAIVAFLLGGALLSPLAAQARVYVDVDVAPPAPRVIEVPEARPGRVWAPGYYDWDQRHNQHVWHDGRYVHERPGYHYRADHWEQRGDHWHRVQGGWDRG